MSSNDNYVTLSIASLGDCTIPKPPEKPYVIKKINDITDIDGAQGGPKYKPYLNKPHPSQADVYGSTPKSLTWTRNVRDNSLYIDDIEGTRHSVKDRMMRTGRHVNPLAPEYKLPAYVPVEYPQLKFIKDPLDHSDIEGCHVIRKAPKEVHDIMMIDDIPGVRSRKLAPDEQKSINSDQINALLSKPNHRFYDRTNRFIDPNAPVYHINGMDHYDDISTKPRKPRALIVDSQLLQTKDILGATPGWRPTDFPRREYKNTNYLGDIPGAQADTIKHSIITKRETHPLVPVYQALDGYGELLEPLIPPLLPPSMIKVPTVPLQRNNNQPNVSRSNSSNNNNNNNYVEDYNGEYDPVSFMNNNPSDNNNNNNNNYDKPPLGSGRKFKLDFSSSSTTADRNNKLSDTSFGQNNTFRVSPYTSARNNNNNYNNNNNNYNQYSDRVNPTKLGSAAANSFSNTYPTTSPTVSARGYGGSSSGRGGSGNGSGNGMMTLTDRKVMMEREAEIKAVKALRE